MLFSETAAATNKTSFGGSAIGVKAMGCPHRTLAQAVLRDTACLTTPLAEEKESERPTILAPPPTYVDLQQVAELTQKVLYEDVHGHIPPRHSTPDPFLTTTTAATPKTCMLLMYTTRAGRCSMLSTLTPWHLVGNITRKLAGSSATTNDAMGRPKKVQRCMLRLCYTKGSCFMKED